ncbi:TPA: hypothetical protein HA281_05250 [Candidatus Woesearchaeota archaeon]|nr:MAG: 50S ribosomal protein L31e [archaeon GW2011_AR11]MBS3110819.1 60S ribosomal protein L31 [Candidatus Woesearchaeota archaeon]HIH92184.1 hypothetical protein [Candidatus Woesearchaeota archaeon]
MAKEESSKVVLERTYTIPLSRELLKVPAYKKAKKAVRTVQAFIRKHMKAEKVLVGQHLNMKLWEHGIKNPPKNIKVTTTKDDKGVVRVELFGAPKEEPKKESKVKPAKKIVEAEAKPLEEAVAGKAGGEKPKEAREEEAEKDEKEDIAEQKKELSQTHHHAPKQPKEAHFEDIHPRAPKHQ